MRRGILVFGLFMAILASASAQRTDLSGLKFCIDPGHGGHNPANDRLVQPDPGIDFWESESNFQKALHLKLLLENQGATVILTRLTNDYPNDNDEPSLTARWTLANQNNVHWFHSIHSNASGLAVNTSINYTLMLVKEDIPSRTAAFPEAVTMSDLMGPAIREKNRTTSTSTWLDYTFYGGPSGGFNLGVLRGLVMPGELSEGSFHDFFPETRRLMNNSYRKMEAYALRNAFMQYYGVPADPLGIIAGIQTDIAGARPVNGSRVRLLPLDRVADGDQFNNGFYGFDSLTPGSYTVRFETPGYQPDSVQVLVAPGATVFADRVLQAFAAPRVVSSSPVEGDTAFVPTLPIVLNFSKVMDTASVRRAFSILPVVTGTLAWSGSNTAVRFVPSVALPMPVNFTVTVDTNARSGGGQQIDGNGDGTGGDPFLLHFRTRVMDVAAPRIVLRYPDSNAIAATANHCVNIVFDELLNPLTVIPTNFIVIKNGTQPLSRTVQYAEAVGRGAVNVYVSAGIEPGASYRIQVSGVKDLQGNAIPPASPIVWSFSVAPAQRTITVIDSLNGSPAQWIQPASAAGTIGIDSARFFSTVSPVYPVISPNAGAATLKYAWSTGGSSWLLRAAPDSGSPVKSIHWKRRGAVLQAYLYGNAGMGQFRFAVEDSVEVFPAGTPTNKEVSRWYDIDWVGWRLVEWDMERDSIGTWVGNGRLEGELRFDGIQMRYIPGLSAASGQIVIDQIQIAQEIIVAVEDRSPGAPREFALLHNYPNPFNPSTTITYQLAKGSIVSLRIYDILGREVASLVNARQPAGTHAVPWNANGVSSGVYFARVTVIDDTGSLLFTKVNTMVLLK